MSQNAVPLHRVFHSIRFKVNKIGIQRYPFFCALTLLTLRYNAKRYTLDIFYLDALMPLFYDDLHACDDIDAGGQGKGVDF